MGDGGLVRGCVRGCVVDGGWLGNGWDGSSVGGWEKIGSASG